MTAPLPRQRVALLDTAAVAAMLDRTPGYVRLLVHQGKLTPVTRERTKTGATRMLFDAQQVFATLRDTPSIAEHA